MTDSLATVVDFLQRNGVESGFYLDTNPDLALAGVDPARHFAAFGLAEGRVYHPGLRVVRDSAAPGPSAVVSGPIQVGERTVYLAFDPEVDLEDYRDPSGRYAMADPALVVARHLLRAGGIDEKLYLEAYEDVGADWRAGMVADPLWHFLSFGIEEGRSFHPRLSVIGEEEAGEGGGLISQPLRVAGRVVRLQVTAGGADVEEWLARLRADVSEGAEDEGDPELEAMAAFLAENGIGTDFYRWANSDLSGTDDELLKHFMLYGFREGRPFNPRVTVAPQGTLVTGSERRSPPFEAEEGSYELHILRAPPPISERVLEQVCRLAEFEPVMAAFAPATLQSLRRAEALDLKECAGFDYQGFLAALGGPFDCLIAAEGEPGGPQWAFVREVAVRLEARGKVVVVVDTASDDRSRGLEGGFGATPVLRWARFARGAHEVLLARLVNAFKPDAAVFAGSEAGMRAVARFGRGMAASTSLACVYFTPLESGASGRLAARFASLTAPYSRTVTTSQSALSRLDLLWGALSPRKPIALSPIVGPLDLRDAVSRIAVRIESMGTEYRASRAWLWAWGGEVSQGSVLLAAARAAFPEDRFDVLGSAAIVVSKEEDDGVEPLVRHLGPLGLLTRLDVMSYQGMVLAGDVELPAAVAASAALRALPVIAPADAELIETLGDGGACWYRSSSSDPGVQPGGNISEAMGALARLQGPALRRILQTAVETVASQRDAQPAEAFFDEIFGGGND